MNRHGREPRRPVAPKQLERDHHGPHPEQPQRVLKRRVVRVGPEPNGKLLRRDEPGRPVDEPDPREREASCLCQS
jgi:hypothetical protein